jgi:hypothetical protein
MYVQKVKIEIRVDRRIDGFLEISDGTGLVPHQNACHANCTVEAVLLEVYRILVQFCLS